MTFIFYLFGTDSIARIFYTKMARTSSRESRRKKIPGFFEKITCNRNTCAYLILKSEVSWSGKRVSDFSSRVVQASLEH